MSSPLPASRPLFGRHVLWLVAASVACSQGHAPATHLIAVEGFQFQPMVDTVRAGDSVSWSNRDIVPHTATSDAGQFDSGTIDAGASWGLVAKEKGRLTYHCTLHPTMKGVLVVR